MKKGNDFATIGVKPAGWSGKMAGKVMNGIHSSAYKGAEATSHIRGTLCDNSRIRVLPLDVNNAMG